MLPRTSLRLAVLLALPLAGACHLRPMAATAGDQRGHTVTAEQIERSGARTAWDALRLFSAHVRLDGGRIASRGAASIHLSNEPLVVMDGVRLVEHGLLRDMSADQVTTISLITGPDATTHYGTGAGHGVLVIRTRLHQDGPAR